MFHQTPHRHRVASQAQRVSAFTAGAAAPLSITLEEIEAGHATFTSRLSAPATAEDAERLYRVLAEFATEAAVQSALLGPGGFRSPAFKFTLVRGLRDVPHGVLEAQGDLVGRGPTVLRAIARVYDTNGMLRAWATLIAVPAQSVPQAPEHPATRALPCAC